MSSRIPIPLLLATLLASSAACTAYTAGGLALPVTPRRAATSANAVEFVESTGDRPYVVLGKVHAHGRCNRFFGFTGCGEQRLRQTLVEQAAALGASAVINVQSNRFGRFEWKDVHVHGTAIAWQP